MYSNNGLMARVRKKPLVCKKYTQAVCSSPLSAVSHSSSLQLLADERLTKQMDEFAKMSRADIHLPEVNDSDPAALAQHKRILDILNLLMTTDPQPANTQHRKKLRELLQRDTQHHYRMFKARPDVMCVCVCAYACV